MTVTVKEDKQWQVDSIIIVYLNNTQLYFLSFIYFFLNFLIAPTYQRLVLCRCGRVDQIFTGWSEMERDLVQRPNNQPSILKHHPTVHERARTFALRLLPVRWTSPEPVTRGIFWRAKHICLTQDFRHGRQTGNRIHGFNTNRAVAPEKYFSLDTWLKK